MSIDRSREYGLLDILSVLSRAWIPLLAAPIIAGLGVGYWAYSAAQREANLLQVESVVSLPSVDRAVIDLQGLFALAVSGATAPEAGEHQSGAAATLRVDYLGDTYQGARSLVRLAVRSTSGEVAERALQTLVQRLASIIGLRNAEPGADGRIAALEARIAALTKLWDQLAARSAATAGGDAAPADLSLPLQAIASASVVNALSASEAELNRIQSGVAPALRTEIPPAPPIPVPVDGSWRWMRLPIAAAIGAAFLVLLAAFALDGVRRAREGAGERRTVGIRVTRD